MKNTSIDLSVDFIGGQASLTKAEEIALSEFFQKKKIKNGDKIIKTQIKVSKRKLEKA